MIGLIILIPSLFSISTIEYTANVQIVRDFVLLSLVFALKKFQITAPYTIFVSLGLYSLFCEMINDLSYKLLSPNIKLKQNWINLQQKQNRDLFIKLIELKRYEKN